MVVILTGYFTLHLVFCTVSKGATMTNFTCHLSALRAPGGLGKHAWHWSQGSKEGSLPERGQVPREQPRALHRKRYSRGGYVLFSTSLPQVISVCRVQRPSDRD